MVPSLRNLRFQLSLNISPRTTARRSRSGTRNRNNAPEVSYVSKLAFTSSPHRRVWLVPVHRDEERPQIVYGVPRRTRMSVHLGQSLFLRSAGSGPRLFD